MRTVRWLGASVLCALVFVADLVVVETNHYQSQDDALGNTVRTHVRHAGAWVSHLLALVSRVAHRPEVAVLALAALLLIGLVLTRRRWSVALLLCTVGGVTVLDLTTHRLITRPLPHLYGEHSFPSGHTLLAVALLGLLVYLAWHVTARPSIALLAGVGAAVLVVLVALERLTAHGHGVHYPSDLLGGAALGGMWLAALLALFARPLSREGKDRSHGTTQSK